MSTKSPPAAVEAAHEFEYETSAARELLRVAGNARPRSFMDARRSATCRLLGDLTALFAQYGYQTGRRADREWGHVWTLTFFHESLCLTAAKNGSLHCWIQPHQGDRKLCGLDLSLTFDPAEDCWMGPRFQSSASQPMSGDTGRTSALEEVTRGLLTVIQHQIRQ
jgi:hypothetical protein